MRHLTRRVNDGIGWPLIFLFHRDFLLLSARIYSYKKENWDIGSHLHLPSLLDFQPCGTVLPYTLQ